MKEEVSVEIDPLSWRGGNTLGLTFEQRLRLQDPEVDGVRVAFVRGDGGEVVEAHLGRLRLAGAALARYDDALITVHLAQIPPRVIGHSVTGSTNQPPFRTKESRKRKVLLIRS